MKLVCYNLILLFFSAVTCIVLDVPSQKQTNLEHGNVFFEAVGHVNCAYPFQESRPSNKSEYCNLPDQIDVEEFTLINKLKTCIIFTQIVSVETVAIGQFVNLWDDYRMNTVNHAPLFKVFRT